MEHITQGRRSQRPSSCLLLGADLPTPPAHIHRVLRHKEHPWKLVGLQCSVITALGLSTERCISQKHCSQDSGPSMVFLIIPRDTHTLANKEKGEAPPVESALHFPTYGRLQFKKMLMSTLQKKSLKFHSVDSTSDSEHPGRS